MASSFVSHSQRVAFSFGISENNCNYMLFNLRIISCHSIRNSLMRQGEREKERDERGKVKRIRSFYL